jgi:hypothetical protein
MNLRPAGDEHAAFRLSLDTDFFGSANVSLRATQHKRDESN